MTKKAVPADDRTQINVRLDAEMIARVDEQRIALHHTSGNIPTRSDIVRIALEKYLPPAPRARKT